MIIVLMLLIIISLILLLINELNNVRKLKTILNFYKSKFECISPFVEEIKNRNTYLSTRVTELEELLKHQPKERNDK